MFAVGRYSVRNLKFKLKVNISGNSKWMGINDNFHQLEFGIKKFFDGGPYQFKL